MLFGAIPALSSTVINSVRNPSQHTAQNMLTALFSSQSVFFVTRSKYKE